MSLILVVMLWSHRQLSPRGGVGDPGLTYHGDGAEGHNQRERSEGVGGKDAELAQQHQEQAQPPRLGLEVGPRVLGACQPDVTVLLEHEVKQQRSKY